MTARGSGTPGERRSSTWASRLTASQGTCTNAVDSSSRAWSAILYGRTASSNASRRTARPQGRPVREPRGGERASPPGAASKKWQLRFGVGRGACRSVSLAAARARPGGSAGAGPGGDLVVERGRLAHHALEPEALLEGATALWLRSGDDQLEPSAVLNLSSVDRRHLSVRLTRSFRTAVPH